MESTILVFTSIILQVFLGIWLVLKAEFLKKQGTLGHKQVLLTIFPLKASLLLREAAKKNVKGTFLSVLMYNDNQRYNKLPYLDNPVCLHNCTTKAIVHRCSSCYKHPTAGFYGSLGKC